jgi:two-component system, cell cycle sensor histidine kinase and response regulator CckA
MNKEKITKDEQAALRKQAEAELGGRPDKAEDLSPEAKDQLLHELRVHQMELEMQNEELRRSQLALEAARNKYSDLYDFAPVGYFSINEKGMISAANLTGSTMLGVERGSLMGKPFSHFIHMDDQDLYYHHRKRLLKTKAPRSCELRLKRRDGSEFHARLDCMFTEDSESNSNRIRAALTDISEAKRLEIQLQQAQKMEAIGTLSGGIAHDFNNILGGIIGYAELAKMKAPEGSDVLADLEQVLKSSKRAADLVSQILTISRHHKKEQRPVQVRYIVHEATSLLRATLPTTIEIRENLSQDAGIINADPTQMHQVIMNLGTNAGHAMQENGGVLEVSLANVELDDLEAAKHLDLKAGPYLRLTVSDTGHGMASEVMERIFDPYFTTKDTGEGTGLGLSVAQGIVKTHGGTIRAYSEPGKGTIFHVYLPIILEAEREEENASEKPLPTGSECILLIDDEQVLIEVGRLALGQLGYEVVTQQSSVRALELFRAEPDKFDLVITDMTMPHMTGDQLARALKKIRPHIPVMLCTGNSRLISDEKIKEIGIKAVVIKPVLKRTMAETVREVLDDE